MRRPGFAHCVQAWATHRVRGRVMRAPRIALALFALCANAASAHAQYPYVPPPLRCIPVSEGPGILAGIVPTAGSEASRGDLVLLQFTYAPLPAEADVALRGLRDRLESRLRAARPRAVRAYAGPAELRAETLTELPVELSALSSQLGADRIIAGRIDQDGTAVRLVLDIYDARTGTRLWRTRKSTTLPSLLGMEIDLAKDVGAFVFKNLTPPERAALTSSITHDDIAYSHYVRGVAYLRDTSAGTRAVTELRSAAFEAPKVPETWSSLALAYVATASTLYADSLSRDSIVQLGIAAAAKAYALAPDAAHAWIARGAALGASEPPRPFDALIAYERAAFLEPTNAEAHWRLGRVLLQQGRSSDAQMHLLRAITLQPEDPTPLVDLGELELNLHAYDQSCRALDMALSMNPRLASAYLLRAMARVGRGDVRHAWIDAETGRRLGIEVGGQAVESLVDVAARDTAGATDRMRALERRLKLRKHVNVSDGGYAALGLAAIGDRSGALDLLERVRPRGPELYSFMHRPGFDWLWTDARFHRLLEASNAGVGK
jgi:tetratricopeptide (TPR) repeat protein